MSIGLVSDSSFAKEMAALGITRDLENKVNEEVRALVHGRGHKAETPMAIRALVASESIAGASSKELQDAFNVSGSSVSAYKHGVTSTADYNEAKIPELVESINQTSDKIGKIATGKLLRALDAITDKAVSELSPLKAADLATKMSAVIKNTRVEEETNKNDGVKIIVFQPRLKEEDEFETIKVIED